MASNWPWLAIGIGLLLLLAWSRGWLRAWLRSRPEYGVNAAIAPAPVEQHHEHSHRIGGGGLDPATVMQMLISVMVLGSALYVILSGRYADAEQKWAYGAVGTVCGFWFKK